MKQKKVLYVNYSPYENQGKILDFLLEEYRYVFMISIGHHAIDKKKTTNKLTIYRNGKAIRQTFLFHLPVPKSFVFVLLPFRSFMLLFQLILLGWRLRSAYGPIDYYFTVNGYTAWIGLVLRQLGIVSKTIYWVCDYYPVKHKDLVISIMRWLYWQFEKYTVHSDLLAFHNMRLVNKWRELGVTVPESKFVLVPIGTSKEKINKKKPRGLSLCFLGVLKRSQGVDFILNAAHSIAKKYPQSSIHIIGPGPDRDYFETIAKKTNANITFYGYVTEEQMDQLVSQCKIGLALYVPDPSHVSYYGDPGKIKKYISHGLPVIATNIHEFTQEIENNKAGEIVRYGNKKQLLQSIRKVNRYHSVYAANARKLRSLFYNKRIYKKMFVVQ